MLHADLCNHRASGLRSERRTFLYAIVRVAGVCTSCKPTTSCKSRAERGSERKTRDSRIGYKLFHKSLKTQRNQLKSHKNK